MRSLLILVALALLSLPTSAWAKKPSNAAKVELVELTVELLPLLKGSHLSEPWIVSQQAYALGKKNYAIVVYAFSPSDEWYAQTEQSPQAEQIFAALDEAMLRCDEIDRSHCVDDRCPAEAKFQACLRKAYPDPSLYEATLCSVNEVYVARVELGKSPRVAVDSKLEAKLCDCWESAPLAIADLDLDGHVEVAISYTGYQPGVTAAQQRLRILDADDLHEQFSGALQPKLVADVEQVVVGHLGLSDDNGDGFPDLDVTTFELAGSCDFYYTTWLVPSNDEYACKLAPTLEHRVYDPDTDVWK